MFTVVARYRARPGEGGAVAATLARHSAATRAEPGCAQFVAYRAREDGDEFVLYEQYEDEAAFEAHRASPHFRSYVLETIVPLLVERTWQVLEEVPGAD